APEVSSEDGSRGQLGRRPRDILEEAGCPKPATPDIYRAKTFGLARLSGDSHGFDSAVRRPMPGI
ncbi:MAG: hypothetical protein KDA89_18455, partial [Planctomycetaceae bacterium]|nr:hypothetical protein [Planctomycetaceae bacterium]